MAFPAGLTLVTVAVQCDLPPSGGATGMVQFTSPTPLVGPTDNSIVPPFTVSAALSATGSATVQLPATNDPDWTPQGWTYAVRVQAGSQDFRGTLQLDYQTTSVQLADLIQVDGAATVGVTYATLAQLNAVDADVTAAEGNITALQTSVGTLTTNLATANATANGASAGSVKATDHGLVAWTFDPAGVQAGTVQPTAGLAQVVRVRALSTTVTNILLHLTAGGSVLTAGQCFAALYTDAGVLLASTADQASNWGSGGLKTCTLTAPQTVTLNAWYRVLWWFQGTTGPTISRGVNSSSAIVNVGMTVPTVRYSTANTGLTTAAPGTIGTQTGGATAWWVGLS
jgi:hypothetical protein